VVSSEAVNALSDHVIAFCEGAGCYMAQSIKETSHVAGGKIHARRGGAALGHRGADRLQHHPRAWFPVCAGRFCAADDRFA
jgi:hypothetical protein